MGITYLGGDSGDFLGWRTLMLKVGQWWMAPLTISHPKPHCASCCLSFVLGVGCREEESHKSISKEGSWPFERRTDIEAGYCSYLNLEWDEGQSIPSGRVMGFENHWKGRGSGLKGKKKKNI